MNALSHRTARFAHAADHGGLIAWEDMPSLTGSMKPLGLRKLPCAPLPLVNDTNPAWNITMPAMLDDAPVRQPFQETLRGLVTRELNEPELFQHFFG